MAFDLVYHDANYLALSHSLEGEELLTVGTTSSRALGHWTAKSVTKLKGKHFLL